MNRNQQRVTAYLFNKDDGILHWKFEKEVNKKLLKLNLDDLIIEILGLTYNWNSYNEKNSMTCWSGKWRSSLDIWRHVKFYKPDVTIFQVMNSMFSLQNKLCGHYCTQIYKRVFMVKIHSYNSLKSLTTNDEYVLKFHQWKNIDKE